MQGRSDKEIEILFQTICRLAKEENAEALMPLIEDNTFIQNYASYKNNHPTPFYLLAKEGNEKAINFLNNKFELLHEILKQGGLSLDKVKVFWPNNKELIEGYGAGGYLHLACEVIFKSLCKLTYYGILVTNLARAGHSKLVIEVLRMNEINNECVDQGKYAWETKYNYKKMAIKEYLQTESIAPIIDLIKIEKDASFKPRLAFTAFLDMYNKKNIEVLNSILACIDAEGINKLCNYFNNKNLLKEEILEDASLLQLLSRCDYPQLREALIDKTHINRENLLKQASKLHYIMREKKVNYEAAINLFQCWSLPIVTQVWFSQGIQLVKDNIFPAEIFLLISSFVLQNPDAMTSNIFNNYKNIRCNAQSFFQPIMREAVISKSEEIIRNYENRFN